MDSFGSPPRFMPGVEYVVSKPAARALNYARRIAGTLSDPLSVWDTFQERLDQRREYSRPTPQHVADAEWEERLHRALGWPSPCASISEFEHLWPQVVADVASKGISVGPASFAGFNDGDAGLVRAIWCLIRHRKPFNVVETGVGHGFTSRFILDALQRNGQVHLYSIDRLPLDPTMRSRVGIAVSDRNRERWTLIAGTSRRRLPRLLSTLGEIDLFVHDSRHTERNVVFELSRAWPRLKPGGALVVDDIDSNWGFDCFSRRLIGHASLICEAEPVRPDFRRFNNKGQFAIVIKSPAAIGGSEGSCSAEG
jgi:hypothetical protein